MGRGTAGLPGRLARVAAVAPLALLVLLSSSSSPTMSWAFRLGARSGSSCGSSSRQWLAPAHRMQPRMGLDPASRPRPRGPGFRHFRASRTAVGSSGGGGSGDFAAIGPQTLNWEKVGPDQDIFINALSQNGQVGVKVVSAPKMLQGMKDKRKLQSTVATELLGRVMLSCMLVSFGIKDEETLQLTFNGDGLARGVMAISDGAGNVRSWIGNPYLDELRDPETGKADIKAAVGHGTLQVVKQHPSWRLPYNGVVQIASGEVAPDVAFYLASSEQRNTAIAVGAHVDHASGTVDAAGGWYIEMLPGVEEESIAQVEANLAALKDKYGSLDPGQLFASGPNQLTPHKLVKLLLDGLGVGVAEETAPAYKCTCSKEKVFRAMRLLSEEEVEDILAKEGRIVATCEFCNEEYTMEKQEVRELRQAPNPNAPAS